VTPSLSWADSRTLIVTYVWAAANGGYPYDRGVLALDTSSAGGSLQAHSRLLTSDGHCTDCLLEALAGPAPGTLIVMTVPGSGSGGRILIRLVSFSGHELAQMLSLRPTPWSPGIVHADQSGRYLILTPPFDWIKDGKLVHLPVPRGILADDVAW